MLAVILFIPLIASGGGRASAAAGWSMIDGGGPNGINVNPANMAEYAAMTVFNDEVYVAWQERVVNPYSPNNQIRVKKRSGTNWVSIDGNGLNVDASKPGIRPAMAEFDGQLYIAWTEKNAAYIDQVRIKKYNGTSWTSAEGGSTAGINADVSKNASIVNLAVYNDALYAAWSEAGQLLVKKYDGTAWTSVDGAVTNAASPVMAVLGDDLIAVWFELVGSNYQIRAKKYDGTSWTAIDGGSPGLNIVGSKSATNPSVAVAGDALYVAWDEPIGNTDNQVRVKKYDGTSWSSVDGGGEYGLNVNPAFRGNYVELTSVNNELYAVWQEHTGSGTVFKIRVKKYDGTVWTSAEGGLNGLIMDATKTAQYPAVTVLDETIYVSWQEKNSVVEQIRVASYTPPPPPAVKSVDVSPSSANVARGQSRQLTATVDAVGGAAATVTWTSSDADGKVAVSGTGSVTVAADAALGDYTITAASNFNSSKTATATITVTEAPAVNSVSVSPSTDSVMQGDSIHLTATVDAAGGAATTVTWTSSDAHGKVAVSITGDVTVAADAVPGYYTITATSNFDTSKKGTATITVTEAPAIRSVSVSPSNDSVVQGDSLQLTATVDAAGGAATTVTWTSSDTDDKVTVDSTGNVTVAEDAEPDNYTITATSTFNIGKKGTATITVTASTAVNGVSVSPSSAGIVQGESRQLTALVDAVGEAETTVSWTSNDAGDKVTVDSTGNVTVAEDAEPGDYIITATSTFDSSKTGMATITVTAAPTYTIAQISNETLTALTQGYESGTQEKKNIPVVNTGSGDLENLSVSLSGSHADDFTITQPDPRTLAGGESTSFDIVGKDDLSAGTYTATVTVSADRMTPVTFTVTQSVNLPDAPANPQNLEAVGGDREVMLSWSTVPDATQYRIYMATDDDQSNNVEIAIAASSSYSVQDLVNGTTYYFVVKAENAGVMSEVSNQASATPSTVPGAPTHVKATAGNGRAVVTFRAPADNGGSPITGYEVIISPGGTVVTGGTSPITITGLTNGTSYTFTVKAINDAGGSEASEESNAVTPRASHTPTPSEPSTPTTPDTTNTGVDILVNGKVENAGTATVAKRNDQTEITVAVDQKKLDERLAAEGANAVVTIPINQTFDIFVAELNGQMVRNMEDKQAVLEFKTEHATYTLPAQQINIGAISEQLGKLMALQDIKVRIEISVPTADTLKLAENAAASGSFELAAPPLNFTVTAVYGDRIVEVTKFDAYVERTIAIPDGIDPNKITTGVVVEQDGSVRHVPTKVRMNNGKYEAQINSLTNSTYAVVWHPIEFSDVAKHWAKNAVNDMGSRMVVDGTGNGMFSPSRDITRAEFTAIIVRGLGLKLENGATPFSDVLPEDWYGSAVNTAYSYGIVKGMEDGNFRPNDKITREQAMVILSKAMAITGLKDQLLEQSSEAALLPFGDAARVSPWAQSSVADNVQAGIVMGRNGALLAPKAYMTRAEVATTIQRLLQKSGLI